MGRKKQYETIGARIKKLRAKNKLTQEALARKANMSYISLVKIENDLIESPGYQTIYKISKALGVTLDEFVDGVLDDEKLFTRNEE